MTEKTVLPVESSIEIDAPPARVWEVVSDVRRAPEWSDQAWKVLSFGRTRKGTISVNLNRQAGFVWPTTSRVVEFEPGRRIGNRIFENSTVWVFELEPVGVGTRLTERRETPQGISAFSRSLTDRFFGGQEKFTRVLGEGVSASLERIKRLAEQG